MQISDKILSTMTPIARILCSRFIFVNLFSHRWQGSTIRRKDLQSFGKDSKKWQKKIRQQTNIINEWNFYIDKLWKEMIIHPFPSSSWRVTGDTVWQGFHYNYCVYERPAHRPIPSLKMFTFSSMLLSRLTGWLWLCNSIPFPGNQDIVFYREWVLNGLPMYLRGCWMSPSIVPKWVMGIWEALWIVALFCSVLFLL